MTVSTSLFTVVLHACFARAGHFLVADNRGPSKQWRRLGESSASNSGARPMYLMVADGATPTASRRGTEQRWCSESAIGA